MRSFNFNAADSSRALSEINVVPLVDVMCVLLIIFMIATPMIQSGIEIELPKAKAAAPDMEEGLIVTIARDQSVYLEKRKLSLAEFDAVFSAVYPTTDTRPVFIRADGDIQYKHVITIIDKLKSHGVTNVGLATSLQSSRK